MPKPFKPPYELPPTVAVGPYTYRMEWSNRIHRDGRLGECDTTDHRIRIKTKTNEQTVAVTTVHEWLHSINDAAGIVDGLAEEEVVTMLAPALCAFVRANVEAFVWWLQRLLPEWEITVRRKDAR